MKTLASLIAGVGVLLIVGVLVTVTIVKLERAITGYANRLGAIEHNVDNLELFEGNSH